MNSIGYTGTASKGVTQLMHVGDVPPFRVENQHLVMGGLAVWAYGLMTGNRIARWGGFGAAAVGWLRGKAG